MPEGGLRLGNGTLVNFDQTAFVPGYSSSSGLDTSEWWSAPAAVAPRGRLLLAMLLPLAVSAAAMCRYVVPPGTPAAAARCRSLARPRAADGYVFVPDACATPGSGPACETHISFHGCQQDQASIGLQFVFFAGVSSSVCRLLPSLQPCDKHRTCCCVNARSFSN